MLFGLKSFNRGAEIAINDGLLAEFRASVYSEPVSKYIYERFGFESAVFINKGNTPEMYLLLEHGYMTIDKASDYGIFFDKIEVSSLDDLKYAEIDASVTEIKTDDCVYERSLALEIECKPLFGQCKIFTYEDIMVVIKEESYTVISGYFNMDINHRG